MTRRIAALTVVLAVAAWIAGCAAPEPQPVTDATTGPDVAAGHGRLFVMREHSIMQGPVRAEVAVNDTVVAALNHETYTYLDLPSGRYLLSVAGLPNDGSWRMAVEVAAGTVAYLLVAPNRRPEDRQTVFPDSRKFDLQGGPFVVRPTDARTGEGLLRTMKFRPPSTRTVRPATG